MKTKYVLQPNDPVFHGQDVVYMELGEEMLQHAFQGNQILPDPTRPYYILPDNNR